MTRSRARAIERMLPGASERKVRALYLEVHGAHPADSVPLARVREAIVEALREEQPDKEQVMATRNKRPTRAERATPSDKADDARLAQDRAAFEQASADLEVRLKGMKEAEEREEAEAAARWERQVKAVEDIGAGLRAVANAIALVQGYKTASAVGGGEVQRAERAAPVAKPEPQVVAATPASPQDLAEACRKAVREAVKGGKGGEAVAVLGKLGAESVSDLRPEQLSAALTKLQALSAAKE